MRSLRWMLLSFLWLSPAVASEKVETGPAPAWVRPIAIPSVAEKGSGSISYLLSDEQVRLEPGKLTSYYARAIRIETAEGLSAGNISLSWQPDTQTITIHRLMLHRGDRTIDLLGEGRDFTILRRESNLESAMLDGELTVNIQPEGLRVGDIIDMATTTTFADPLLRGHVEHQLDADYSVTVQRQHLSAQWPASLPIHIRQTPGMPTLKSTRKDGLVTAELTVDGLEPGITTRGAPLRYQRDRMIELSDFADWSDIATLFMPLYERAARLPADSPLNAEISAIAASATTPKARAEAALALVQGHVRYVALLMGTGNFQPADPTETWKRRFGDCKAKSALLLALLRGLGISAEAVLVNIDKGDGMDERLPMVGRFNHVIVRATIDGKAYWLDGTRTGDNRLDNIDTPDFGWGLPLVADAKLVRLVPDVPKVPLSERVVRIDMRQGISMPAPMETEIIYRGEVAYGLQQATAALTPAERERRERDFWQKRYPSVAVETLDRSYDPDRREYRLKMKGNATLKWDDSVYWLSDIELGDASVDFERDEKAKRSAPFLVRFPYFDRSVQTFLLPHGVAPDQADVDTVAGGVRYRRKTGLVDNVFTVETSTQSLSPEFPAGEAASAQKTIRALADGYIGLRVTSDYARTEAETLALLAKKGETAEKLSEQGIILLDRSDYETALLRFEQALALDPDHLEALAGRGVAQGGLGDYQAATRDLDAVEKIKPDFWMLTQARAVVAHMTGRWEEAIRYYDTLLATSPDDSSALAARARMHSKLRQYPAALKDAGHVLDIDAGNIEMRQLRADIYVRMGQANLALAEVDRILADHPNEPDLLAEAAYTKISAGKREAAVALFSRAIDIKKTADLLVDRSIYRAWSDVAGRSHDVMEALQIDPANVEALRASARLQVRSGDLPGAARTLTTAIKADPGDVILLSERAQVMWLSGSKSDARKALVSARAIAKDDSDFWAMCWNRATVDMDLTEALADCDAAVAKNPTNYAAVESRAFTLVKLGRYDEAIESYDRALALMPTLAEALLGRAIAWKRKGDQAKADADMATLRALDDDIVDEYRFYGLTY